jgi:hypothetical protein
MTPASRAAGLSSAQRPVRDSTAARLSLSDGGNFRSRLRGKWGTTYAAAITALLYGAVIAARITAHQFDASFFVTAGYAFCQPAMVPDGLRVDTVSGYDGQFYYRIALDPWTTARTVHGITIDYPPYREQRILYPLLARALALARPQWVPWTMILVSYLAICALGFTSALFARAFGMHPLEGLVIPFYPGVLLALDRDLPDALSISLMLAAVYLLHSRRLLLGASMLALAVLARETVVLLAGALFAESLWRTLRRRTSWTESACLLIPLASFATWQLWIFAAWRRLGIFGQSGILSEVPFKALALLIVQALELAVRFHPLLLADLTVVVGTTALAATALYRSAIERGVKVAWICYLILACVLSGAVWVEDWAFMRATAELLVLSLIILISARQRASLRIAGLAMFAMWTVLAVRSVLKH